MPRSPSDSSSASPSVASLLNELRDLLDLLVPDEGEVGVLCRALDDALTADPKAAASAVPRLVGMAAAAESGAPLPLLRLLDRHAASHPEPWSMAAGLLEAEGEDGRLLGTRLAARLLGDGVVAVSAEVLRALDRTLAATPDLLDDAELARDLADGLRNAWGGAARGGRDPLVQQFTAAADPAHRRLLAGLLDATGARGAQAAAAELFDATTAKALRPWLAFVDGGFRGLTAILEGAGGAAVAGWLQAAAAGGGERALRTVLAETGWERCNLGLRLTPWVRLEIPGCLPLVLPEDEALLCRGLRGVSEGERFLVAELHGRRGVASSDADGREDPVGRFRALNLVHAELLAEFMDMAPLDRARIDRILAGMRTVVTEYAALFGGRSREARVLPDIYAELEASVMAEVGDGARLTAEAGRLMLMFEDPARAGDAATIHGLKRYLHQKGLALGLNLVDTSREPGHTVDLLRVDADGAAVAVRTVRYAVFETPAECAADPWLPRPVGLLADGLRHQLVHGQREFPGVNVFVFGNEAHYYLAFRNHPAFLRLDSSPPRRGGMLDLGYMGVSNYELDVHPAFELEAIQLLFRRLGFDVKRDGTRLKVRFDKETCSDLGDLEAKAASLFRLAPFLMSVDWAVGSLDLDDAAKALAARAWAERFAASGVLPLREVVSDDGRAVVTARRRGPTGPVIEAWDGRAPYVDRCAQPYPAELAAALRERLRGLGVEPPRGEDAEAAAGIFALRRRVLDPLRDALDAGLVTVADGALRAADPEVCVEERAPESFARLLAAGGSGLADALAAAPVAAALEPFAAYAPAGRVGGLRVESAALPARGGPLHVHVARDDRGAVRLALLSTRASLTRWRDDAGAAWRDDVLGSEDLRRVLAAVDELATPPASPPAAVDAALAELRALAAAPLPAAGADADADARVLPGQAASPGRVVGRAVFAHDDTPPESVRESVLFSRKLGPEDTPRLLHAAGIVSAGGSLLSHACLMALQFGKPALLVRADAYEDEQRRAVLRFTTPVHRRERIRIHGWEVELRRVEDLRRDEVREGDLVVLDADAGCVRVLGQDRDALALAEGLRLLDAACRRHGDVDAAVDLMESRGQKLRARHLLEKALGRLSDPALAAFAVEEIAVGEAFRHAGMADRVHLLQRLFDNPAAGAAARRRLADVTDRLADAARRGRDRALAVAADSVSPCEVLSLRLRALDARDTWRAVADLAADCGEVVPQTLPGDDGAELDAAARGRLAVLRDAAAAAAAQPAARRHRLRRHRDLSVLLGDEGPHAAAAARAASDQERDDAAALAAVADRLVLDAPDCGHALHPLVGWKAANLAELTRLLGGPATPAWFVVTDAALARMLAGPAPEDGGTLAQAVAAVLKDPAASDAQRTRRIRDLWLQAEMPPAVADAVRAAYRRLDATGDAVVAVRSSFCDEDTESTARAGLYDSFLQVRGDDELLQHLRLAWAGLWSERALAAGGRRDGERPTGGVLVQVMVDARCAGVLQTVDVPHDDHRSLVASVGLGLGEGVVSGLVATDLVTVAKNADPDDPDLRLHYVTNDKTTQVVADRRRRGGTRVAATLYHQRLRPALEYLELAELVSLALRLEEGFGHPLDIEFALEGAQVRLLQARPVGAHAAALRETRARRPL